MRPYLHFLMRIVDSCWMHAFRTPCRHCASRTQTPPSAFDLVQGAMLQGIFTVSPPAVPFFRQFCGTLCKKILGGMRKTWWLRPTLAKPTLAILGQTHFGQTHFGQTKCFSVWAEKNNKTNDKQKKTHTKNREKQEAQENKTTGGVGKTI